ncbi:MAG: anthranilate synthase component I family protein [Pyrinomonadaceae bacterium]
MQTAIENLLAQFETADIFPVVSRFPADLFTPFSAYMKIADNATQSFLFESVEGGETLARYSFLGANPREIVRDNNQGVLRITREKEEIIDLNIFEYLREYFGNLTVAKVGGLPSFIGGAVGNFEFDAVGLFEPCLKREISKPRAEFAIYDETIAFDHAKQEVIITKLLFGAEDKESFRNHIVAAFERNKNTAAKLLEPIPKRNKPTKGEIDSELRSKFGQDSFINAVNEIKEQIAAGECYQVVISRAFERRTNASAESIYRALRSLNPSPYMFLISRGTEVLIGASPETLIRVRDRELEYRPIAGTVPRGKTQDEDARLAAKMKADEKERAEHIMLVDLGRNDLGRVAKFGTVRVRELMAVEKFSHVQHLVSYLFAELDPKFDRFDALVACFPAGTVTGAPKIRAIEIIHKLEPEPRGFYSGAVGYIDYADNLDVCIAIRTMRLSDGIARIQSGAGIVADSNAEREFQETIQKANGLLRAIELAEGGKYDI